MASSSTAPKNVSAQQAAELLRAGAALMADQLASALANVFPAALEHRSSQQDASAGAVSARRMLASDRDELRRRFVASLRQEQGEALGRLLKREQPSAAAPKITAELLALVDDDVTSPGEVVSKVARRMRGALDEPLRETSLIASYLSGKETVRPDDDPLSPDVIMKALLQSARDLGLEAQGWEPFLAALERPLVEVLAGTYGALNQHFRKNQIGAPEIRREMAARQALGRSTVSPLAHGLAPASSAAQRLGWMEEVPRVNTMMSPAAGGGGGAGGRGSGADGGLHADHAPAWAPEEEARASLDEMIGRMGGTTRTSSPSISLPAPGRPPPDLIDAISEMQRRGAALPHAAAEAAVASPGATASLGATAAPGGDMGPVVAGVAPAPDQGAWRDVLLAKSTRTVDKLTIEIVGMLFENVLHDGQVPAEIKAALSRLQFPVLKVALTDADFFASNAHPARRLIDRLASTAIGWEPYGDENQSYKAEVERVVQQVLERFDKDVGTFEHLLGEFETFIGELPARETDPLVRARRALEEAEKREVLVINTTIQVRRAFEHVELEPYLREFLVGPWVQALVSATMRDEQTPGFSKAFRQVIHDVVWSVQPKVSADERKRLVSLIPVMTRVLRDGLALIRMSEHDQQNFLKQLMASHAVAVRPVDQATYIKSKVATGDMRQKLDEMKLSGTFPIGAPASGVHVSVNALKRAAEKHSASMVIAEPLAAGVPMSLSEEADFDAQIANWQRGSWFSLYDGQQTIKVKLRWISPLRTLFMFSGGEEKNARVLSPETIKSYLRQGWLKPLEAEPLMKRAVDRVVSELERSPKLAGEMAGKAAATELPKPA